jgi:hypothetical protein
VIVFKVSYYYEPDKNLVGFRPVPWMRVEDNEVTCSSLVDKKNTERAIALQTTDRLSCYSRHKYNRLYLCPVQKLIKIISDVGCQ